MAEELTIEQKIEYWQENGEWPDPDGPSDWDETEAFEIGYDLAELGCYG